MSSGRISIRAKRRVSWSWKGRMDTRSGIVLESRSPETRSSVPSASSQPVERRQWHPAHLLRAPAGADVCRDLLRDPVRLSRDGKLSPNGDINLLQGAVLLQEVGEFHQALESPIAVQNTLFPVLAAIGRIRGYRARYQKYALPTE